MNHKALITSKIDFNFQLSSPLKSLAIASHHEVYSKETEITYMNIILEQLAETIKEVAIWSDRCALS